MYAILNYSEMFICEDKHIINLFFYSKRYTRNPLLMIFHLINETYVRIEKFLQNNLFKMYLYM